MVSEWFVVPCSYSTLIQSSFVFPLLTGFFSRGRPLGQFGDSRNRALRAR